MQNRKVRTRPWHWPAAAGFAALVSVLPFLHARFQARPTIAALIAASPSDARVIEPRVSGGFAWAPFRPSPAVDASLASAVANTLATLRSPLEPDARHLVAVAQLLTGRPHDALSELANVAESARDPRVWNDLAVAYYEVAIQRSAPELFADALAACDRALSINPQLAEAHFNRALLIERLGLRDDARAAWEQYLHNDSASPWANEAREHMRALAPETPFLTLLDQRYDRPAGIRELVRHDPQGARTCAELEILGRWGIAVLNAEAATAERHLRVAREIGAELPRVNGYRMLDRAVAAIEAADASTRAILAAAYAEYHKGRKAFRSDRPVEAEPLLRRARAHFEQASSPMALRTRYFAANAVFEQGRHDEAQREIETLLASVPEGGDPLRAELLWQLGVCHATRAEWGDALRVLNESLATFTRIGETQNAASVHRIVAVIYERTGDADAAWKHRMIALRDIGRQSGLPLLKAVASIAESAMLRRNWPAALSFLNLEIEIARRLHDDVLLADALLVRSAVHGRLGDARRAADDIASAEKTGQRVRDPAYREYFRATWLRARAIVTPSPAEAISLLSDAIAVLAVKGARMDLPALYLLRARALRNSGDLAGAEADLQRGIAELETQRASLPEGDARWGAFVADEELFEEAIDLALDRNDSAAAFAYTEKTRARALLEAHGRAPAANLRKSSPQTVIVEYAALPSRLVIFTARASGVRAVTVAVDRATLTAKVDRLARLLQTSQLDAARAAAADLHRLLVQPIASDLLAASTVVFVPDAATAPVPFSALAASDGTAMIERYTVVIAPSSAAYLAAAPPRESAPRSVLVIRNAAAEAERLTFVETETKNVVRAYRHSMVVDNEVEITDVIAGNAADVIHFAGHAVGDDSGLEPASLLLWQKGKKRRIGVGEIARVRLPRPSVVVLAGCSTARGERRASEGVISVAHGFLTAGAYSIVATLWPIEDEAAARFFPRLHERLAEGLAPAEALRAAQIESIRRGDVPPSLWAAVQNIGN